MPGLYSPFKVYTPGEVLTAADLNATDQTHITNQVPQMTDDYSQDLTQKRQQSDPTNTLATSLAIELQQIRYVLAKLGGKSFWDEVQGPPATASPGNRTGTSQLRGLAHGLQSVLQLDANSVTFSGGTTKNGVSATLNLATPGPAPNGRDRAADFPPGSWVNVFYIYNPTSGVVALTGTITIAHVTSPPVMPAGYTEYCYATSLRIDAVANQWMNAGRIQQVSGSNVTYHPYVVIATGLGHIPSQALGIGHAIPWDRLYGCMYRLWVEPRPGGSVGSSGAVVGSVHVRAHETLDTFIIRIEQGDGHNQAQRNVGTEATLPVWSQNLYYGCGTTIGTILCDIFCLGYQVPNNDV